MTPDFAKSELKCLTAKQLEALILRAKGCDRFEIAAAMNCGVRSVDKLLAVGLEKLGTNSYAACWLIGRAGLG